MAWGGIGVVDRVRACIAGRRDGRAGRASFDEVAGRARSSFLAAERARSEAEVDREAGRHIAAADRAELELRTLRGVYAGALQSLPDEDAVGAAEQARAEALAALHAYRAALDGLWAVVERCGKRYECLGQTYLRQAGLPAAKLDPCEAPARLNACETRYAAFEKLVDGGYFDRHYR